MTTYKPRPLRPNGVKVEKILQLPPVNLPAWLDAALLDGRVIKLPDNTVVVTTPQGKRSGTVTDMVIKSMIGDLSVVPTVDFLAEYEAV